MLNSRVVQERKAQIALFVIIALVLIAALVLYFSLRPGIKRAPQVTEPQDYIEKCMKDAASEALDLVSKQGGSINPKTFSLYDNNKISYLCYTDKYYTACTNLQPMLKYHLENEIIAYAYPKIEECISTLKEQLTNKGYSVKVGSLTLTTKLQPEKVIINAEVPITVTKEETKRFDKFQTTILSPLYGQVMLAQDVVNSEISYGDFEQLSYMLYHQGTDIEKKMIQDDTIYLLEDRNSNKQFIFAMRNYIIPPGF